MRHTRIISILSILGAAVSTVALFNHYSHAASAYCNLGPSFNCDLVNRSVYSKVLGVPVAAIGVAGYGAMFALARLLGRRRDARFSYLLFSAALLGLAFALYLTYIEAFVLAAWCILCVASLVLIAAIAIISFSLARRAAPYSVR